MDLQNIASTPFNDVNDNSNLAICLAYYDLTNSTYLNNQIGGQDLIWIDSPYYLHGSLIEQKTTLEVHYEMALIDASVSSGGLK